MWSAWKNAVSEFATQVAAEAKEALDEAADFNALDLLKGGDDEEGEYEEGYEEGEYYEEEYGRNEDGEEGEGESGDDFVERAYVPGNNIGSGDEEEDMHSLSHGRCNKVTTKVLRMCILKVPITRLVIALKMEGISQLARNRHERSQCPGGFSTSTTRGQNRKTKNSGR